jgi:hypothetical protein
MQSENLNELALALAKAQGEISPAIKDSANPFFKSKYADLNSIWSSAREPLSKNGLAIIQTTEKDQGGQLNLITTLVHASGQWVKSYMPVIQAKADIQSLGSALTYCRRYSLSAICGISTDEDDDGEKSMARQKEEKKVEPKPKISQQQIEELSLILGNCSDEYQKQIWEGLNSQKIYAWESLTPDLFHRVRNAAIKQAKNIPLSVAQ